MIRLAQINHYYALGASKFHALKNINLEIQAGEFVALTGPSGSGKTTLLNLLGLIDPIDSGQYWLDDQEMNALTEEEATRFRRERMGFIFQHFNLMPFLSVFENVAYPLNLLDETAFDIHQKVASILESVGLIDHINKFPESLSGGQRQRVALARALVKKPQIIIADEPTAALDHQTAEEVMQVMKTLAKEQKTTLIMATHDPRILPFCDRKIELYDGELL